MAEDQERVVLLDEVTRKPIGSALKSTVHNSATPLHSAFSCFLFDDAGDLLITQRALSKKTWPGIWSNSVCGHPAVDEKLEDAVYRRAFHELGIPKDAIRDLTNVLPDFKYYARTINRDGAVIVENECCPVFVGFTNAKPVLNRNEVEDFTSMQWARFLSVADKVSRSPSFQHPENSTQFSRYKLSFGLAKETYEFMHTLRPLSDSESAKRLSEWSLWEARLLAFSPLFESIYAAHLKPDARR